MSGLSSEVYTELYSRDCRLKYVFSFDNMLVAFSDSPTFCDLYETFFIQFHSVEAELQASEYCYRTIFFLTRSNRNYGMYESRAHDVTE